MRKETHPHNGMLKGALDTGGIKPLGPMVLSGVVATLLAVAVLACIAPAWRASRLAPMKALRTE